MNTLFLPRGIRNNNPGNIRLSKTTWHGQKPVQDDADFAEFTTALYGLRALMKTLLTYHLKYGLDTVESIINRYAPPHENATDRYIHQVARAVKAGRTETIDLTSPALLAALARAIVLHENGRPPPARPSGWYDEALYAEAARLAFSTAVQPH